MTREEAIEIVRRNGNSKSWYEDTVDTLVDLQLLKLDDPNEAVRIEAIGRLKNCFVEVIDSSSNTSYQRLTIDGAAEAIDVLAESGFKITR
jgi:hypothetical protein